MVHEDVLEAWLVVAVDHRVLSLIECDTTKQIVLDHITRAVEESVKVADVVDAGEEVFAYVR